jgi:hypothetical protein
MATEDALAILPEHWADVITRLGTARSEDLGGYIAALDGPSHKYAVARIADLLVEGLPPEHPVRRALLKGDLFSTAAPDVTASAGVLRVLAAGLLVSEARPGEQILRAVADRLLLAPALSADDVRQRGADPGDTSLIRLDRADGGQQWPAFQFVPGGGPWPVVREVNQLLGAAEYPLGAADWWLSRNSWLGDPPSQLIGRVPDDHLIRAAHAIRSEV